MDLQGKELGQWRQEFWLFCHTNDKGSDEDRRVCGGKANTHVVRMIVISSSGRTPWQKAFLQSPWQRERCLDTAMVTRNRRESLKSTGAYWLLLL
jgi:hypothetical protein